ncbi:hypothetical protein GHT07_05475 [Caenimonas koreensis DSM 17982]|uniref:Peptidase metallopeptidase domain-containing protein n=2 Tax=Caenimonas TaxID=763439 RepID=A0A844AR71_9BURK|nr:hypothetical protein [Caenimonas koreensis DSM 17982]
MCFQTTSGVSMLYLSTSECAWGTLDTPSGAQVDADVFLLPDLSLAGEAGASPGSFATTPQGTYQYVAQSPTQGMGNAIDALMSGSKWSGTDAGTARTVVTYSFVNAQSSFSYAGQNNFTSNVSTFSEADKALTRTLLGKIEAVCNVEFVEVAGNASECGVLRYGYSPQPNVQGCAGFAYFPSSSAMGGDIWIGANQATCTWDFYRPNLILHETLHAIGLKHPFEAGAVLSTAQDIVPNTVMSYSTVAGGSSSWMSAYPSEPMPMDVAALQCLYGAAPTNTGDTTYDLSGASFQGFSVLWDAGGNDTLDAGALAHAISLDLRCGVMSDLGNSITAMAKAASGATLKTTYTGTLSIAAGATIENAIGTAFADSIGGNEADSAISGGAGNDRLEGRGGNDVLDGGDGIDTAMVEAARDGYSISKSGASYTLSGGATGTDVLTGVERIAFTDANIALDLDGNAGIVAKIIGAVLGASYVQDASYVGVGLAAIDNGMSATALMEAALNARLGAGTAATRPWNCCFTTSAA